MSDALVRHSFELTATALSTGWYSGDPVVYTRNKIWKDFLGSLGELPDPPTNLLISYLEQKNEDGSVVGEYAASNADG